MAIIKIGAYEIEVEEGRARKRLDELNEKERRLLGRVIMRKVLKRCKKFGTTPVIGPRQHWD